MKVIELVSLVSFLVILVKGKPEMAEVVTKAAK